MDYSEATAKLNYPCPHCGRLVLSHSLAETIFCANEGKITAAQNKAVQDQLFVKLEQALAGLVAMRRSGADDELIAKIPKSSTPLIRPMTDYCLCCAQPNHDCQLLQNQLDALIARAKLLPCCQLVRSESQIAGVVTKICLSCRKPAPGHAKNCLRDRLTGELIAFEIAMLNPATLDCEAAQHIIERVENLLVKITAADQESKHANQ